jgi:hypothetical protein
MFRAKILRPLLIVAILLAAFGLYYVQVQNRRALVAVTTSQQTASQQAKALANQVKSLGKVPVVNPAEIPTPIPGPQGAQGDPGNEGPIGPQGVPGSLGPVGPRGAMGLAGRTPPCLLLPGACQGATGPAGATGKPGADGTPGVDGKDGAKGDQGEPGKDGKDGVDGKPGADGKDGADGQQGVKGDKGDPGPTCPDGTTQETVTVVTSNGAQSVIICAVN